MQYAVHLQIVQPGKDALLTDAQAACDDTLFEIGVGLERGFKQRTDKADHFIVKPTQIGVLQRYIVLVDEDDGLMSMIFGKAFRQEPQRFCVSNRLCLLIHDQLKLLFFFWG